jgi:3-methyladenine DNA glycosylase AlkD
MTSQLANHLREVTERTERLAGRAGAPALEADQITRLGIRVPDVRRTQKHGYSFSAQPPAVQLNSWDYIWRHSNTYEVMSQALYAYQHRELLLEEIAVIRRWIERCGCWEHSDDLSKIYAAVVEANPSWMVPTLAKWNRSSNPWKRRQSVVSLIEYAARRSRFLPFEQLIALVEPLLDDDEYYVQKGVGWTLREIYNAYPVEAAGYIEDKVLQIAPLAWSAATAKLDKRDKLRLNAERKANRAGTRR